MTAKRAAAYVRVSSEAQSHKYSPESQLEAIVEYAAKLGYTITGKYNEVHTAEDLWERPQLMDFMDRAERGEFDTLICYDPDRLSRSQWKLGFVQEWCKRHGVTLKFATVDFEKSATGRFLLNARVFAAELELEKIKERTNRGKLGRLKSGKLSGTKRCPFGYRWADGDPHNPDVPLGPLDSKLRKTRYEEDPVRGPVVRKMFALAEAGSTAGAIAKWLESQGIKTPNGNVTWARCSITQILSNIEYTGVAIGNRTKSVHEQRKPENKNRASPRAKMTNAPKVTVRYERPTIEQVHLHGLIPPLVGQEQFDAVQARLTQNKQSASRNSRRPEEFLLRAGHIECGYCGVAAVTKFIPATLKDGTRIERPFYVIPHKQDSRQCGHSLSIAATTLDALAWGLVDSHLRDPILIQQRAEKLLNEDPTAEDMARVTKLIAEQERQYANWQDSLGLFSDPKQRAGIAANMNKLYAAIQGLQAERAALEGQRAGWLASLEQLDSIKAWTERFAAEREGLEYDGKRAWVERLNVKVRLFDRDRTPRWEMTAAVPLLEPVDGEKTLGIWGAPVGAVPQEWTVFRPDMVALGLRGTVWEQDGYVGFDERLGNTADEAAAAIAVAGSEEAALRAAGYTMSVTGDTNDLDGDRSAIVYSATSASNAAVMSARWHV